MSFEVDLAQEAMGSGLILLPTCTSIASRSRATTT
jgi:hypothetical protein